MLQIRRFASQDAFRFCKICIIGANGGIGKSLALQLKENNRFSEICLYDITSTEGTRVDLSHINTLPEVTGYSGVENIANALKCSDIVVITAGQSPSKTITNAQQLFDMNAARIICFVESCIKATNKQPHIHIVTNPVNSLVPLAAGVLKKHGFYNPKRLSGSCSVNTMRASSFLAQQVGGDPRKIQVPIIGGHSKDSIVPLISQSRPTFKLDAEEQLQVVKRIQNGADEVIQAKKGQGGAQLMVGYSVGKFCDSLVRSLQGEKNVIDVAYVPADVNELPFFTCLFELDREGVRRFLKLPDMMAHEKELLCKAKASIAEDIRRAESFLKKHNFM